MNPHRNGLSLALLTSLALAGPALAFSPELSPSEVSDAYQQGKQMAGDVRSGYKMQDWVLFDQADPMTISPGEGVVEAVILRTPFELLRYESYLKTWTDQEFSEDAAQTLAADNAGKIRFLVYGHSQSGAIGVEDFVNEEPGQSGRDFLEYFRDARFSVSDGSTLEPTDTETFGPGQDFYVMEGGGNELRWLGYRAFTFDLSRLGMADSKLADLSGTFSFTDSSNEQHSYQVNLADFH